MSEENKKDKLEELQKSLYTKGFEEKPVESGKFEKKEYEVQEEWKEPGVEAPQEDAKIKISKKMSPIKKILLGSFVFFIAALGFAVFKFYMGSNIVSPENIDISIKGPVSISGGEEFSLDVLIGNKSDAVIESAYLLVEYPEGAYSSFDLQEELVRAREPLDDIDPSGQIAEALSMVLFGEENSEKEIKVTLEFRFQGSGATLEKTETYKIRIASSPLNLSFSLPQEGSSKQEVEMTIELESNSNDTIKNLLLQFDYPFGFNFKSATPSPTSNKNIWDIGDLDPSDNRTIKVLGTIDGQEGDEKVFRVYAGTKDKGKEDTIGTTYNFISESIFITKPFLGLNLLINGDSAPEYVSGGAKSIRADVLWKSNIPTRIIDGQVEVKLAGNVLDKFSVTAGGDGFYRSIDNTIVWNKNSNSELSIIEPGEEGSVSFTFQSLPLVDRDGRVFQNPEISIDVSAGGKRISDVNVPEETTTSIAKKIKIESDLTLTPRIVYHTGPFKNSGSLPPKAEQETTYTIIWTATNSSNEMSGAVARATLPTYVRWLGITSPTNEDISFNEVGGEVVWNIGDVRSGTGFTRAAREVAFQVSFLPSVSQISSVPHMTGETTLTAEDTFTGTIIKDITRGLSTQLSTDPYFDSWQASVTY